MYKRLLQCFQHFAKKCLEHKIFILSIFLRPLGKKLLGKIVVFIRTGSRIQQGHYPSRIPGPVFLYLLINFSTAVPLDSDLTRGRGGGLDGRRRGGALPINLLSQKLDLDMSCIGLNIIPTMVRLTSFPVPFLFIQ